MAERENQCKGPQCIRPSTSKKYQVCSAHYQQLRKGNWDYSTLTPLSKRVSERFTERECLVTRCTKPEATRGLCNGHAGVALRRNIHPQDVPEMYEAGCFICGAEENLQVDHDHGCCPGTDSCGKCNRGVLCVGCNTFLGKIEKMPDGRLQDLLDYVRNPPGLDARPYARVKGAGLPKPAREDSLAGTTIYW